MVERMLLGPGGATEAKQDDLLTAVGDVATADTVRELLARIYSAVDGLELSADTLNLNVDGVEALLASVESLLTAVDGKTATGNSTLASLLAELQTQQKTALTDTELRASDVETNDDAAHTRLDTLASLTTDIKRGLSDFEERYEFDAEGLPLYLGKAPEGSLTTDAVWTVVRFTFDIDGLPTRKQTRTNVAWDSRAAAGW